VDNTIIDYKEIFTDIKANSKKILVCFLVCIVLGLLAFFILPKKYTSEAKIMIKSSEATNLAFINPYAIQENQENSTNSIFSSKSPLNEELEIIKSPLVLDNVIKENNLKYEKGLAKGKYLSAKDFIRKNFSISKLKETDVIYLSYKSKDPILSYNVVSSVIKNYKKIKEDINSKKAVKDTKFLEKECLKAEQQLNFKINKLKSLKQQPQNSASGQSVQNINLLGIYDKRFQKKLKQLSDNETDLQKMEAEIIQNTEELNSLKKKLSWSSMVNEISKNTTDLIVLQQPEIKEPYDYAEPNPVIIAIFSLLGGILSSLITMNFKKF
jgi:uncharacterized protein involved in exopolysaccharide biosynthesis